MLIGTITGRCCDQLHPGRRKQVETGQCPWEQTLKKTRITMLKRKEA
jgi:hypothetical protein